MSLFLRTKNLIEKKGISSKKYLLTTTQHKPLENLKKLYNKQRVKL